MSSLDGSFSAKAESTYGTGVVTDRAFPVVDLGPINFKQISTASNGLTARYGRLSTTARKHRQGGTLPLSMEWLTKGMGWWGRFAFGGTSTGSPTDSAYPHTLTVASLHDDMFTGQCNMPLHPAGTDQAITLRGCKIPKWEFDIKAGDDNVVMFNPEIDAQDIVTDVALASVSPAAGSVAYDWVDVSLTVGGSAVPVDSLKITGDNNLKVNDVKLQGSALQNQPSHAGKRKIEVEMAADFSALATFYNRVRTGTAASALAQLVVTMSCADSGTMIGAGTQPSTVITVPKLFFVDLDDIGKKGPDGEGIVHGVKCEVLDDGTNPMMTCLYTSADSTA